jgi:arginyl-tRNA synthetase
MEIITMPPPDIEGDFSVPCFNFAKTLKKSPKIIAEDLAAQIKLPEHFSRVTALNGYLNFSLEKEHFIRQTLLTIQSQKELYGKCDLGKGKNIVIDFSSPNMGKELAFHHLRGTMLGNALSRIYEKCGFHVIRINHLGDWGTSYGKLILMYLQLGLPTSDDELSQIKIQKLNDLNQSFAKAAQSDPELENRAREVFQKLENGDPQYLKLWQAFRQITLIELEKLYSTLNVDFDEYTGESFFIKHTDDILKELKLKKLLTDSRDSQIVDLTPFDLPPLMLRKSDGTSLYATRDLVSAIYRKKNYNFHKNLYVVDNGQALHFKQFFKILELMGYSWAHDCEHIPFGLILIQSENGKWEKGKTRIGGVSLLKDVIKFATEKILLIINEKNPMLKDKASIAEKIAIGALVYNDLKHKRQNDVNFDWETVLSFEGNSGPYVVNAYVRLCSILRKSREKISGQENPEKNMQFDFTGLKTSEESNLIQALYQFPDKVQAALEKNEPALLGQYALLLAEKSHRFIHACRVLGSPEQAERLCLVDCTRVVLKNTLELIGIPLVEEM